MINKNRYFGFRVSEKEYDQITRKIERSTLSASAFLIRCALSQKVIVIQDLRETRRQLLAIGNNLNQIARLCNLGKISCPNLSQVQATLDAVHQTLNDIRDRIQGA